MATIFRTGIKNLTANPIALPAPYHGIVQGGQEVIVGDSPATVIANLGGVAQMISVFEAIVKPTTYALTGNDGGVVWPAVIADPGNAGAVPVALSGVCNMVSAGAETRTVAAPSFIGQTLALNCDTHVGDIVVTFAAAYNNVPDSTITYSAAGQVAYFEGVTIAGALTWRLVANVGAALST